MRELIRSGRAAAALAVLGLALGIAACGDDDDSSGNGTGAGQKTDQLKLGVSFTALTPYDVVMDSYIKKEVEAVGGEELGPVANNFDAGKQITDIRSLITSGANGLFIRPADSKALGSAIDFANEKKASIVVVDDVVEGGGVFMNVKADNVLMGETACEAMGDALDGKGKVLSLEGDPGTANGRDRTSGFADCMAENYPDIEVIGRPTKWETERAANATQTVLGANPDLAGIYLQSETLFLAPVVAALKNAGKDAKVGEPGHVVLVGIDGTPQALDAIRSGQMDAVVSQPIDLYAKYGVFYNKAAQEGKTFKAGPTDHGSEIVEIGGTLTDLLEAPLVTNDNVDQENLWGNSPDARG
jgi:ABC-type sugar transport system substrate-binding protein